MKWSALLGLAFVGAVHSFASTDSLQDADPAQSGYLPNHNMDPNKLSTFKQGWKNTYNANEAFYAKPLTWTPAGSNAEQVILVSNQNIIRIVDGATGALLNSRTLDPPFAATDSNCGDIPNTIGITGTPYIDGSTNIMYFFSKGYKNGAPTGSGTLNGQYKFYAVQLPSLNDANGFPIVIDGNHADNDPTRYFLGGTVLQRPAVSSIGNIVMGGFGGHCDNFNYTGMFVAVSKVPGVGITNIQAMEANPGAPQPQTLDYLNQGGGKAGIWMGGMGMATDAAAGRVYFVTGNGRGAGDNGGGAPASGKKYTSTLQQVTVHFDVSPSGVLTQADYFEPYEYQSLNGGDRDFGSSGAALLDPVFSGNGVSRIIIAGGKSGKIYIMNADNLGGFANGPGGSDSVIQTILAPGSMLSGVGSYPLEGGYIYFAPSGFSLFAYKFGTDNQGNPVFTQAGKSALTFAGKTIPTITTLNGQPGTAIVWMADVNNGLVAYNAIPQNGVLVPYSIPATGRLQKNQRPGFGNGRCYSSSTNNVMMIGGSSTPPPLTCTPSPLNFGSVTVGQTKTVQVTCTAGTALNLQGCTTGLGTFSCSGIPASVASGGQFTFPVTFDLTDSNIEKVRQGGFQVLPGAEGTTLNILSSTGALQTSVQLTATVVASGGFIVFGAKTVDFGGLTVGGSSTGSVTVTNKGAGVLTLTGYAWQDLTTTGPPFINVTASNPNTVIGTAFTSTNFPALGLQIQPGASISISMVFSPQSAGTSSSMLTIWSDGGFSDVMLVGTAAQGTSSSSSSSSSTSTPSSSSSSSSTISSASTSSSVFSSSSSALTSSSTTSSGPSSVSATTTASTFSTITTSSNPTPTVSGTPGSYNYMGCFSDLSSGHALPLLFRNNSVTPELCEAYVSSLAHKPTPTVLPYYYVEYHRECYGGSSFSFGSSAITSLVGTKACSMVCSGSIGAQVTGTAKCGGSKEFNLYAAGGLVSWAGVATTVTK
ncbi:uncharacterized protein K444DRAFT_663834 [Hyaloscypha bicolor E]|uniref:WSC domain-containing protein n=1 Tax=Hyaloscypha bicolor E TaxID=1095630 RepID=A0A2J6T8Q1_9HELO|nr:uncharacterized protein K444DRAFT_663834 [Hyaloscypha bicolor E]PMD59417.1 hypothetical protein K444DRAFT_663834 [Hyaloscypha bicolor E]